MVIILFLALFFGIKGCMEALETLDDPVKTSVKCDSKTTDNSEGGTTYESDCTWN